MSQETNTFSSLGLSDAVLRALDDLNFERPSPIQAKTIPWLLEGRDLIGLAQTGTGKTAAFMLPILEKLTNSPEIQALVVAPTRELAIQVAEHVKSLSKYSGQVRVSVLCGGQDYRTQLKSLREGAQIVVGTPGRILDHIERKTLKLGQLKTFVLDEADEMLRMGFIEDVETILAQLPETKQMALFSATMPSRIRQISKRYLNNPETVEIKSSTATVKSIEQRFLFASPVQKPGALLRVLAVEDYQGVIVFVRTKTGADEVARLLQQHSHHAMAIHGDLTQALRERIITQFKEGALDILVATDVAARGLDVERVTHVINYDIAQDAETYVHRIGRTGRAGRSGTTVLFVTPKESRQLNLIERHTRQKITKIPLPSDEAIQSAQKKQLFKKISERLANKHFESYRSLIDEFASAHDNLDSKDIAAALALMVHQDKPWDVSMHLPKPSKEEAPRKKQKHEKFGVYEGGRSNNAKTQEMYRLDVGRIHGVKPGNIVGAIANEAGLRSREITGLKIHDYHSTVQLPKGMDKDIVRHLTKAWVCGRQLNVQRVS